MSRTVTKDKIDIREHSVIRCTAVMIAAAVISMSTVLGKPSPFAASFAAAMSGIDCISAFVGSVAGYILGGNYTDGVTVTSALLSVVAIRMIVSRRKSAVSEIVSAVTAAGSVFAANFLTSSTVSEVMNCIILSVMAGGGAVVALRLSRLAEKREIAKITVRSDPLSFICVLGGCAIVSGILSHYSVGIFPLQCYEVRQWSRCCVRCGVCARVCGCHSRLRFSCSCCCSCGVCRRYVQRRKKAECRRRLCADRNAWHCAVRNG